MVEYLKATEEQRELVAKAHDICEKELSFEKVKAYAKANDGAGTYPWAAHHALAEAGFYGMNLSPEQGGPGYNFVTRGLIMEEISRYDLGFAFSFRGLGEKYAHVMNSHIPQVDKDTWLHRQLTEHIGGAFCLTEPCAGSDAKAIETTAYKDGDEWVINGTKSWITNGSTAEYYAVFAWTDKTQSAGKGITAFLVYKGTPGFTIDPQTPMSCMKLCDLTSMKFENVRVPNDRIIGVEGRGFGTAMGVLDAVRPYNVCFTIGAAQRAIDIAKDYANNRMAFGKYIIDHQDVGHTLAELQMKLDIVRNATYNVLDAADKGLNLGRCASGTKGFGIKMCVEVANDVIELLGANGIHEDYEVEKIARDIRGYAIAGGSYNITKEVVSRTMKIKR